MRIINFKRLALAILAVPTLMASVLSMAGSEQPASKPNILFIMVDDMGYADLGVTGSRSKNTVYLDQLANDGVLLTNGYANSAICSPSRTALLSGKYQYRFPVGLEEPLGPGAPADIGLPYETPTLASEFKKRGYETILIGKWHLGDPPIHGPLQHGYDHFLGIPKGASDYFRHRVDLSGRAPIDGLYKDNKSVQKKGYLTDIFADEAVEFIENTSSKKPFMMSLHFNAPHWPWEGPFDEAVSKSLTDIFHRDGGSIATYQEMMARMDSGVGRILAALKEKGLEDNTIVVFTSDNGAERYSDTWPYTGNKGELLEGGIRTPIIIRWPGHIEANTVSTQVMISMDFLPTLVAATGTPVDEKEYDGVNLLGVLTGQAHNLERTLFWRFNAGDQAALRQGDWKFFRADGKEWLFNLRENPRERAQLKDKYPDKFQQLKDAWEAWNSEMLAYPENGYSDRLKDTLP
ncbi:sulfatase [Halioxenophilus sp. WMMB6]|uniref:sulfatase family protein n=1 Tax=Halioxenophilus sp. WMMB6 TaxID=3073815 RepID=UPI00295EADEB|nr:sulfatase-like hydrolase/transferase [Halioxenophilus sp. WMMB6]